MIPTAADERDELWAMAPEGAAIGVVVSASGAAALERAVGALHALLTSSPEVATHGDTPSSLERRLIAIVGDGAPRERLGLDRGRGLAVFVGSEGQLTVVLPVVDRDKLVAAMHGTQHADGDEVANLLCKPVADRYVCVERRAAFDLLSRRGLDGVRRGAATRGDIELAVRSVPSIGGNAVAAAEITRGAITVRGAIHGVDRDILHMLGAPSRPRAGSEAATGFGVFSIAPLLATAPDTELVPGTTFATLGRAVAGPITYAIAGGTQDPEIRVPLRDVAPVKRFVDSCAQVPTLAAQGATVRDGVCRVPIGAAFSLDGSIDGSELRLTHPTTAQKSTLAPTPLARELSQGEWTVAMFGRGIYLDLRSVESHFPQLPPVAQRLLTLVNELGIGVRRDGEDLRVVAGARTLWSNPDDVIAQLLAIAPDALRSGQANEIARGIADRAPESPLAHDLRAGLAGLPDSRCRPARCYPTRRSRSRPRRRFISPAPRAKERGFRWWPRGRQ